MIDLLAGVFIKDRGNIADAKVRAAYGMLCSIVGIVLNLLLFAAKYFAGVLSGSIAITADAFNNLSDSGSSIITLVGFKFSVRKPDRDHPYGHGRIEYISGFAVSVIIILMAVELVKSSVGKLISPEPVDAGLVSMGILALSMLVKLYMCRYNRAIGRRINSAAMLATAADSISDVMSTGAVLLCMLINRFTGYDLDGWFGLLVALLIFKAGIAAARDTLSPLLGRAPDPELVQSIKDIVMSHEGIVGLHDLVVHDYGPGRLMISLHGEVPRHGDMMELHETIDHIEKELREKLGCEAVIHMDPIGTRNEAINAAREQVAALVLKIDHTASIHDFRMVPGEGHSTLVFDMALPADCPMTDGEAAERICRLVEEHIPGCTASVEIDREHM